MSRIVYLGFPTGQVAGGQKMILRHVETLRALGFEAVFWRNAANVMPRWTSYEGPVEVGTDFRPDDILVVPDDAPNAIAHAAGLPLRAVIFCQNQFTLAALGYAGVARFPPDRFPDFISVGATCTASILRAFPEARVEPVPCFADERVFRPGAAKAPAVACAPRKRPLEAQAIQAMFRRFHPRHAAIGWSALEEASEATVAEVFARSALFLSLSRLESVGMTPLEAMASGCVCAGFTGIGGRDFATPENGFWVPEDDCEAAADALAEAADVVRAAGPELARRIEAGRATADLWSYARFRTALEAAWMRLAPEARVSAGPLPA
jgi:hypothetical protein